MPLQTHVPTPGSYAWRLTDDRGRVLAVASDTYPDRVDATADADQFRKSAPGARIAEGDATPEGARFVFEGRDGSVSWIFTDADGELAHAPRPYVTTRAAKAGVRRIQSLLEQATAVERAPQGFDPEDLEYAIVTLPLANQFDRESPNKGHRVLIELDQDYVGGIVQAKKHVIDLVRKLTDGDRGGTTRSDLRLERVPTERSNRYAVATLTQRQVWDLLARDGEEAEGERLALERRGAPFDDTMNPIMALPGGAPEAGRVPRRSTRAIYRIWPDFPIHALLTRSHRAVKADAARAAFAADGSGIVWAVVDSGVDETHPHFETHRTLELPGGILHRDLRGRDPELPLTDGTGHGTHVAGIVAGETHGGLSRLDQVPDAEGHSQYVVRSVGPVSGVAPKAKILSLRILRR